MLYFIFSFYTQDFPIFFKNWLYTCIILQVSSISPYFIIFGSAKCYLSHLKGHSHFFFCHNLSTYFVHQLNIRSAQFLPVNKCERYMFTLTYYIYFQAKIVLIKFSIKQILFDEQRKFLGFGKKLNGTDP